MSLEYLLQKLENFQGFANSHRRNGNRFVLGNHQLVPTFDCVHNGLKRFLLCYSTGAGKTQIPIEVVKHLKSNGTPPKVLVIAPFQTMMENWNTPLLRESGLHNTEAYQINDLRDVPIPSQANFVVVNYEKLLEDRSYFEPLLNYAKEIDLLICDEAHNLRLRNGKRSRGGQAIVEASKDKRMIALTATPAPDKMTDMGVILYLLDPERFKQYRDVSFNVKEDSEAIWEMRERGKIVFFDRDSVKEFYELPDFHEREPIEVEMGDEFVERYFEAYSSEDFDRLGLAINTLERLAIESMIASPKTQEVLRTKLNAGHVLNFFSHLRNPPKRGSPEEGIFFKLEEMLRGLGTKRIESIHGETPKEKRIQIQEELFKGNIDCLINQWGCTQEGFSEVVRGRPVTIIPLRSPFSPGTKDQIIGRSYRPKAECPVEYQEFHSVSDKLLKRINDFVEDYASRKEIRVKTTWFPSLFHRDAHEICIGKEKKIRYFLFNRSHLEFDEERLNVSTLRSYAKLLSTKRIIDMSTRDPTFGTGTRRVLRYVGVPFESGLNDNAEELGKDYSRSDILLYAPGKINMFIADYISRLKESDVSWKIADLGPCSSAVFSQARLLWQLLNNEEKSLDHIVNVDGNKGFVRNSSLFLEKGDWIDIIPKIKRKGYTTEDFIRVQESMRSIDYMSYLSFKRANFTLGGFGDGYNVVLTSQCLQYNNQTNGRDIERIVHNVNNSLIENGHYLVVLTSNTFKNSFTTKHDFETFLEVLDMYGFRVEFAKHMSGISSEEEKKKITLKPFYFIHAIKDRESSGLIDLSEPPIIYANEVEVLTGGRRTERLWSVPKNESCITSSPDSFYDIEGNKIL